MPLHVSSTCAHHQEVKIALHRPWYHHTYTWTKLNILKSDIYLCNIWKFSSWLVKNVMPPLQGKSSNAFQRSVFFFYRNCTRPIQGCLCTVKNEEFLSNKWGGSPDALQLTLRWSVQHFFCEFTVYSRT